MQHLHAVLLALIALAAPALADDVDPRWLDRLSRDDRAALDLAVGTPPPAWSPDVQWHEGTALAWQALRGQVVLVQSWTSAPAAGRSAIQRMEKALGQLEPSGGRADGLVVIALHTPDGADRAPVYLERQAVGARVAIDPVGASCDDLGIYRRPVNVLVDRQGVVRYAGLNDRGLVAALEALLAESYDPDAKPADAPDPAPIPVTTEATGKFPPITGSVGSATDVRGQRAPDFFVQEWMTPAPALDGKVVIVDFWATWCGPCIASIPHMNQIAQRFAGEVAIVGISSEANGAFANGMRKLAGRGITLDSFQYAIAIDPTRRMQGAVKITGIPHVLVMSPDWVVRWQGHPARLTGETVDAIVRASGVPAGSSSGANGAARPPRRWTDG